MSKNPMYVFELVPPWAECYMCGKLTPHKWGGILACRECYETHEQGLLVAGTLQNWEYQRMLKERANQHLFVRE